MMKVVDYKTILLAADLRRYLLKRPRVEMQVHSLFETSANLLVEDELVTLAVKCRELMPMGCIVDIDKVEQWRLKEGDYVLFEKNTFHLAEGSKISLEGAEVQDVILDGQELDYSAKLDREQLSLLRSKLLQNDSIGISELAALLPESDQSDREFNVYSRYVKENLFEFLDNLKNNDQGAALMTARRLIGFGPGLTPSCDDFISGIILLLYYKDYDRNFLQKLVTLARNRTTLLSYHMIRNAAAGKAYKSYLDLIKVLSGGEGDSFATLIDRVLRYGASSGADFLFGVYCAALLYQQ